MCSLTVSLVNMFVCLAVIVLLVEQGASGFNLDTDVPIVKRSAAHYDTYFGYSVAAHQQRSGTV